MVEFGRFPSISIGKICFLLLSGLWAAGMYIPSLLCLAGSADTTAPRARDRDLELANIHPRAWTLTGSLLRQIQRHSRPGCTCRGLHSLPCRLFCTNVLGMLPANCQDKSLPRPALLLGRGSEFEKDLVKDKPVFAIQRHPNLVCHHPSHCSDR